MLALIYICVFLVQMTFLDLLILMVYLVLLSSLLSHYIYSELSRMCLTDAVTFIFLRIYAFNYPKDSLQRCLKSTVTETLSISFTGFLYMNSLVYSINNC